MNPEALWSILLKYVIVLMHFKHARCCGDEYALSTEEQIARADAVVLGTIVKQIPQPRTGSEAYTSEMDVHCVLKGGPLESEISISDTGFIPPGCLYTNVTLGGTFILTIEKLPNGKLRPMDREIPYSPESIAKISKMEGLDIQVPIGKLSSTNIKCPISAGATFKTMTSDSPTKYPEEPWIRIDEENNGYMIAKNYFLNIICLLVIYIVYAL